jgi:putative dehydrogenase
MSATVAFVGLGAMGSEMAANLVAKQWRVVGYDRRREAVDKLVASGGHGAASAAEAARDADTLVLMVVNADQAEAVLFKDGALDALKPGGTVVLMATCAPDRIEALAARVEAKGRKFVDAPVSGGVAGAKGGTLTIMAAAPQATFDASRALLEAMGSNLFYLGQKPGQGAAMKIVNQLMAGTNLAVAAEALAFAERAGVDTKVAFELLTGSAAGSWMLKVRGPRMIDYDKVVTSAVEIFVKDLGLVLDSGRALRMGLPIAAAAHQQFLAAAGIGLGSEDDSQVIEVYRTLGAKPKV